MAEKEKNGKDGKKVYYRELEDLPGVGEVTAERLRAKGFGEFATIAAAAPHDLADAGEFSVESAKKAIEGANKVLERRKVITRIHTGSKNLDELLGGGVESQAITEFYGKFSSSKTQVGFQLAVNVQKPNGNGEIPGKVLFI